MSVTRSGDNSPFLGGMSPRTATNGTTGTGLRRRGGKKPTPPQEEPGGISVPAGTPFNESFTEVNRQKSNENLMAELENEMIKITGLPDRSSLGPAHPANRHYTSSSRSQKSSPPTSSVVSKSNQSRGGDSTYQTSHSTSHTPNGGSSLVLSRHNSQQDIILPDYEEDVDFNSGPDSVDAGRSLEDHVKMLQAELDAATIATAESGEMYDYHRRAEDRLEGTRYQSQSDAVSVLSAGDPVDDFDNNDGDYYEKLDEGGGAGRSIGRRAGSRRGSSTGSGHDGRRGGGGGAADRRRGGKRTTSMSRPNNRDFDGKFDGNTPVSLSIKEILLALVVVATGSFGGGYLFSSWVVHPSYLDDDTCTPSPHRIQESATYQMLLTKYESARKEISSLRISAMEDKEFHYKETSLKTKELLKKAEEHTDIVNRHAETMKTTMELQQKLTSVEQMYTDKIRELEEQAKKREEDAVNNAAAKSVSSSSSSSSANEGSTGMEQLNPMADSVQARDAQWRKHDLQMASKIARNSHRAVLQQWGGGGPFRIEFVLQFPGEQGHAVGNRIIIETAPLGMMPHAVHMFLEMAKGGLYTGTKFNFAGSDTVTVNIEHDNDVKKTFGDYTPALSFPEYNDHFPHAEYTLGFMGRDPDALPGPSFFINTKDNREKHGPQEGQFNKHGFNIGAYTCFAKVVAGKHVVDRISKRARYGMHGGEEGMLLKPVEIINTFVHMI